MWWHTPPISTLQKLEQEFEASFSCTVKPCLNKIKKKKVLNLLKKFFCFFILYILVLFHFSINTPGSMTILKLHTHLNNKQCIHMLKHYLGLVLYFTYALENKQGWRESSAGEALVRTWVCSPEPRRRKPPQARGHACNFSTREEEAGRYLRLTDRQPSLLGKLRPGDTLSQKNIDSAWRLPAEVALASIRVHTYACHTCVPVCTLT